MMLAASGDALQYRWDGYADEPWLHQMRLLDAAGPGASAVDAALWKRTS